MNILHIYKTYYPYSQGGVENCIANICKYTEKYNIKHRVFILSQKNTDSYAYENIEVFTATSHLNLASCPISFTALSKFKKLAKWADVLHYHFPWPFADMLDLLARVNKPRIMTYHSDIIKQKYLLQLYKPLMHSFLHKIDHIVATSENYINSSHILQKYRSQTTVIPLGIANTSLYPDNHLLKKTQQQVGKDFLLFCGVLRYYKGLHILLQALQGLDIPLVIAGDGVAMPKLQKLAQKLQLKQVFFLGKVSEAEKDALFALCRIFVFPSHLRSEAFGISLLESCRAKKPMITAEIGTGTSYVNLDQQTGIVVKANDSKSLRHAIKRLYTDTELCQKLGQNAYNRYLELFTAEKMADSYYHAYSKLLT